MSAERERLLEVRDLQVRFKMGKKQTELVAVNNISYDLHAGEALAIVGESGSGKSVGVRALLGLTAENGKVTNGTALYKGEQNLLTMSQGRLNRLRGKDIAMVFQDAMQSLNPTLTLETQLIEHQIWHRLCDHTTARKRAIEMLGKMGIPKPEQRIHAYPFELSGGLRQRAMIAMAMVTNPVLLIADEPTTAVDVTLQRQILDLLADIKAEGTAMIMITHDLGVARDLCDRVEVMNNGEIVESTDMTNFLSNAQHPYSQKLLAATVEVGDVVDEPDNGDVKASGEDGPSDEAPVQSGSVQSGSVQNGSGEGGSTAPEPADVVLKAVSVSKTFHPKSGVVHAVRDVSLDLHRGETIGLVGESGSGKSTLARIFLDLIPVTDGVVEFGGKDLVQMKPAERQDLRHDMQAVFQNATGSLLPHYTVLDNVIEPLNIHHVGDPASRKARAKELLTKVGVDPKRGHQYPRQFSGGQQQRIATARALALDPEILVCDEPTSALDVSVQAQILDLFADLRSELGLTCLFISHNLAVIEKVSDRVAVMRHGWIVELAPTKELFNNPQHPYTRQLLNAVLPVRRDPQQFDNAVPEPTEDENSELVEIAPGHLVRQSIGAATEVPAA